MSASMLERYGGFASVSKIVSAFYDKVLDSPNLSSFFDNLSMKRLVDHQTKFIAQVMGGPTNYSNEALKRMHGHLRISTAQFEELIDILVETLEDFDVEQQDIEITKKDMTDRSQYIVANS